MQTVLPIRSRIAKAFADLKMLLMLSLKITREAYVALAQYAWWAALPFLILVLIDQYVRADLPVGLLYMVTYGLWLLVVLCAVRSSVDRKTTNYFVSRALRFYPVLVGMKFFLTLFCVVVTMMLSHVFGLGGGFEFYGVLLVLWYLFDVWLFLFMLFVLDSGGYWSSLLRAPWNATRLLFANILLFLPILVFMYIVGLVNSSLSGSFVYALLHGLIVLLVTQVYGAIISTIYIKRVYENIKVYCPVA